MQSYCNVLFENNNQSDCCFENDVVYGGNVDVNIFFNKFDYEFVVNGKVSMKYWLCDQLCVL